jgi:hypothetical protein
LKLSKCPCWNVKTYFLKLSRYRCWNAEINFLKLSRCPCWNVKTCFLKLSRYRCWNVEIKVLNRDHVETNRDPPSLDDTKLNFLKSFHILKMLKHLFSSCLTKSWKQQQQQQEDETNLNFLFTDAEQAENSNGENNCRHLFFRHLVTSRQLKKSRTKLNLFICQLSWIRNSEASIW